MSNLYDHPTSPKAPAKAAMASEQAAKTPTPPRWYTEPLDVAARLYDHPIKAGENVAWRSAISEKIAAGLVTQAQSDAQEVKVLTAARKARMDFNLTERLIQTSIGVAPATDEQKADRIKQSLRQLQEEYGEGRVKLGEQADAFLQSHPVIRDVVEKSGGIYAAPFVMELMAHVKRLSDAKKLKVPWTTRTAS